MKKEFCPAMQVLIPKATAMFLLYPSIKLYMSKNGSYFYEIYLCFYSLLAT